jgi:hypothetical protein
VLQKRIAEVVSSGRHTARLVAPGSVIALVLCIKEVPGSNLGPDTGCTNVFQANAGITPKIDNRAF